MPVTLQNRRRQMQVFNLDHDAYCGAGGCGCIDSVVTVVEQHPRTGEARARQVARKVPESLTLLALETRSGLPDAILQVREVKAAVDAGAVRIVERAPAEPSSPAERSRGAGAASMSSAPRPAEAGAK